MTDISNVTKMQVTKSLIAKQACFSKLAPNEIEILASLMTETHFVAGDIIVTEGDPVDCIYLIESGITEVRRVKYQQNQPPEVENLAILKAGDAIGLNETGFYSLSGKRTATVVAITKVTAFKLSVAEFNGFSLAYTHVNEVMHEQAKKIMG